MSNLNAKSINVGRLNVTEDTMYHRGRKVIMLDEDACGNVCLFNDSYPNDPLEIGINICPGTTIDISGELSTGQTWRATQTMSGALDVSGAIQLAFSPQTTQNDPSNNLGKIAFFQDSSSNYRFWGCEESRENSGAISTDVWRPLTSSWANQAYWTQTGTNLYYDGGNVGIGTSTPLSKLSIADASGALGDPAGLAIGNIYANTYPAPTNGMIVEGRIGIGNPSPTVALDVSGSLLVGNGTLSSSRSAMIGDTNTMTCTILSDGANFIAGHDCSLNGWCCSTLGRHCIVNFPSNGLGDQGVALGNYAYAGITSGKAIAFAVGAGAESQNTEPTASLNNNKFVIDVDGNVGIGNRSLHSANIDISGNRGGDHHTAAVRLEYHKINDASENSGPFYMELGKDPVYPWLGQNFQRLRCNGGQKGDQTYAPLIFQVNDNSPSSPTDVMILDSSGNVGIGTLDPKERLDISGNVQIRNGYLDMSCNAIKDVSGLSFCGGGIDLSCNPIRNASGLFFCQDTSGIDMSCNSITDVSGIYFCDGSSFTHGNSLDISASTVHITNTNLIVDGSGLIQSLTVGLGGGAISSNTVVGYQTLQNNTTGTQNVALGHQALFSNTDGSCNVATGSNALQFNQLGQSNVATGYNALWKNGSGNYNTATGAQALYLNTSGVGNTATGYLALQLNDGGDYNVATGYAALFSNISGEGNVAMGHLALYNNTASENVAIGYQALQNNTTGTQNVAFGSQALQNNTTGGSNTATGYQALQTSDTSFNTAVGTQALATNTGDQNTATGYHTLTDNSGSANVATGYAALAFNRGEGNVATGYAALEANFGDYNTAIGYEALQSNTTGVNNVALGYLALNLNETGDTNVAIGSNTLHDNSGGSNNVAIGGGALFTNTTADGNVATGYLALYYNTTGVNNVATGTGALFTNTIGDRNVATGSNALYLNTDGNYNVATGAQALYSNTTGVNNVATGYAALWSNTIGGSNVATGYAALYKNIDGSSNVAIGYNTLYNNTANYNVAIGALALQQNTTGNQNVAAGYRALYTNISGQNNVALGYLALQTSDTSFNTAVGSQALWSNLGNRNTATGYYALADNQGGSNVAIGYEALGGTTNTGDNNVATGNGALFSNTTGDGNVATGTGALYYNTTGQNNVANGYNTLYDNSGGDYNVAIGYDAGKGQTNISNTINVGYDASCNASNTACIGNADISCVYLGSINGNAKLDCSGITTTGNIDMSCNNITDVSGIYFSDASGSSITLGNSAVGMSLDISSNSTSIGFHCKAEGGRSTAIGHLATASGTNSTAMGYDTTASEEYSTAMGFNTSASGKNTTAMGYLSDAAGRFCTAIGNHAYAGGDIQFAIGISAEPLPNTLATAGDNNNALVILDTGHVGIGTSSPQTQLHLSKAANTAEGVIALRTEGSICTYAFDADSHKRAELTNTGGGGKLQLYDGYATPLPSTNVVKTRLSALVNDNNFINNGGNVGIGTDAPYHGLSANVDVGISGELYADKSVYIGYDKWNSTATSLSANPLGLYVNGDISCNGDIRATGDIISNFTSDIRFKTNINKIENPLEKISKINGYTYDWIQSDLHPYNGSDTGIIAQEVETMDLPGMVVTRSNGYKGVKYERLIPLLLESIKSLQDTVAKQQEQINQLMEK